MNQEEPDSIICDQTDKSQPVSYCSVTITHC